MMMLGRRGVNLSRGLQSRWLVSTSCRRLFWNAQSSLSARSRAKDAVRKQEAMMMMLSYRGLHATSCSGEAMTMNVPQLGDSISEGTVNEFIKKQGDYVEQDDVLLTLETDKVTVDVRAEHSGVISEYHCQEGDDIAVGAKLVTIDTEGSPSEAKKQDTASSSTAASSTQSTEAAPAEMSESQQTSASTPTSSSQSQSTPRQSHKKRGHQPLIQFRHGKANRGAQSHQGQQQQQTSASEASSTGMQRIEDKFPSKAQMDYYDLPPMYGRPPISEAEAEAIDSGMSLTN